MAPSRAMGRVHGSGHILQGTRYRNGNHREVTTGKGGTGKGTKLESTKTGHKFCFFT